MTVKRVKICGAIVPSDEAWIYEWFGIECTSPYIVEKQLKTIMDNENFEVEINSGGGDIFAGSEIYTMLSSRRKNMIINVVGLAASAASIIAMAGKCYMSPTSMMMVHNVYSGCRGDNRDMEHKAEILKNANEAVASAYVSKTGMNMEDALEMMNHETWLTAKQAKEKGLIDGIMFEEENLMRLSASYDSGLLPLEVIKKMKAQRHEELMNIREKAEKRFKQLGGKL